jgi:hypothetical protein
MPFTLGGFMTTTNFLVPPQKLVQKWWDNVPGTFTSLVDETELATQAAQWGADQELEACCEWLPKLPPWSANDLRKHRRPKPPSLAKRALHILGTHGDLSCAEHDTIRRALEALND